MEVVVRKAKMKDVGLSEWECDGKVSFYNVLIPWSKNGAKEYAKVCGSSVPSTVFPASSVMHSAAFVHSAAL